MQTTNIIEDDYVSKIVIEANKVLEYKRAIEQIIGTFDIKGMGSIEKIAVYALGRLGIDPSPTPVADMAAYMVQMMAEQNIDEYISMRNYEKFGQQTLPDTLEIFFDEKLKKRVEDYEAKHPKEMDALYKDERGYYLKEYINSLYIEDGIPFDPRLHPKDPENGRFVRTYREKQKEISVKKKAVAQINGLSENIGNIAGQGEQTYNSTSLKKANAPSAAKVFGFTQEEDECAKVIYDRCFRMLHNPEMTDEEKDRQFLDDYLKKHTAAEKALEKIREKAKENYFPSRITGVKQGAPMSHKKADSGKVNPNYDPNDKNNDYRHNCQVCVIVYEMRLRGYKIQAGIKVEDLSANSAQAWINPKTGLPPTIHKAGLKNGDNGKEPLKAFADKLKEGERYHLIYGYQESEKMHIVTLTKEDEKVIVYDPQTNKTKAWHRIKDMPDNISLESLVYYRVDNMALNPMFKNIVAVPSEDKL